MTSPRPTRVQIDAEETSVAVAAEKPQISASVGEIVTTVALDEPVVRTEVVEVI